MAWTTRTPPSSSWDERDPNIANLLLTQDGEFRIFQDGSFVVISEESEWDERIKLGGVINSYSEIIDDVDITINGMSNDWTERITP